MESIKNGLKLRNLVLQRLGKKNLMDGKISQPLDNNIAVQRSVLFTLKDAYVQCT